MPPSPGPNRPGHHTYALWSLCEDVRLEDADADVLVMSSRAEVRLHRPHPLVRKALERMTLGPVLLENVASGPHSDLFPGAEHPVLRPALEQLQHLVVRSLGTDDLRGPLLSAVPVSRSAAFHVPDLLPDDPVALLPTARLDSTGTAGEDVVLEAPGGCYQVRLHRPEAVWTVMAILHRTTVAEAVSKLPVPSVVACGVISHLAGADMLRPDLSDLLPFHPNSVGSRRRDLRS